MEHGTLSELVKFQTTGVLSLCSIISQSVIYSDCGCRVLPEACVVDTWWCGEAASLRPALVALHNELLTATHTYRHTTITYNLINQSGISS
jgi:hypothetical protein